MATFAETLGALSVDEFLTRFWGRNFVHLPGARGRFRNLISWSDVNGMLQRHRLEPPRLRLARQGQFAAKNTFLRYEGGRVPQVVPEKLSAHLRDGYTLIVDAVDDMVEGVMRTAEDFERVLHEAVQVNMYAGWREQQGFNRHCDTHDVIVLQAYGKKYWRVYEGGRPHPLKDDIAPNGSPPDTVVWEGTLEDGDALYIPRGWWHEASGVGEVTLHLTFGIHQRTGGNLLHWVADQLRASTEYRAPLSRFASQAERDAQLRELRAQLDTMLSDRVVERYFEHQDARARSRGWASLPWTAEESAPSLETRVVLAAPRPIELARAGASLHFEANGRAWQFAAAAEPVLLRLRDGEATVAELCQAAAGSLDETRVQEFIGELARQGLVRLTGEPAA